MRLAVDLLAPPAAAGPSRFSSTGETVAEEHRNLMLTHHFADHVVGADLLADFPVGTAPSDQIAAVGEAHLHPRADPQTLQADSLPARWTFGDARRFKSPNPDRKPPKVIFVTGS
jgi:hypothetical protein